MPLIIKDFANDNKTISGIWKSEESEEFLRSMVKLYPQDLNILNNSASKMRRIEFLSTRLLLQSLGKDVIINYDENGKPLVESGYIGITHSESLVATIFNPGFRCSVDIEKISERMKRIANRTFSQEEIKFANNDIKMLTALWCCKEAVYKIVNESGISFKDNIMIKKFSLGEKIKCEYKNKDGNIEVFILSSKEIFNHILVWCIKK